MSVEFNTILYDLEVSGKVLTGVFCIFFAMLFWNRRRSLELKSSRMMFFGQGLFLLCFGLTRLIFLVQGYFDSYNFGYIWDDPALSTLIWRIGTLIGMLSIVFLLLVIETYLVKSRYLFTLIATVGMVLALVLEENAARIATYVTLPFAMIGVIALYAYLFFKSSGELRKKVAFSQNGFILFGIGVVFDTRLGKDLLIGWFGFDLPFFATSLMLIGLAIYTYYNITVI